MRRDFGLIFASAMLALVLFLRFALRLGVQMSSPFLRRCCTGTPAGFNTIGNILGFAVTVSGISSAAARPCWGAWQTVTEVG